MSISAKSPSGASYEVEVRPRGVTEPIAGAGFFIYAGSWLVHAFAYRGQYNVVLRGHSGTTTRGGFRRNAVLEVLSRVEAQRRAADIAASIEKGAYDPWGSAADA